MLSCATTAARMFWKRRFWPWLVRWTPSSEKTLFWASVDRNPLKRHRTAWFLVKTPHKSDSRWFVWFTRSLYLGTLTGHRVGRVGSMRCRIWQITTFWTFGKPNSFSVKFIIWCATFSGELSSLNRSLVPISSTTTRGTTTFRNLQLCPSGSINCPQLRRGNQNIALTRVVLGLKFKDGAVLLRMNCLICSTKECPNMCILTDMIISPCETDVWCLLNIEARGRDLVNNCPSPNPATNDTVFID